MCNFNNSKVNRSIQLLDNLYFAITCWCRIATPLPVSLVYYQATNNVIVLVVIAPASATGARAQHLPIFSPVIAVVLASCIFCGPQPHSPPVVIAGLLLS